MAHGKDAPRPWQAWHHCDPAVGDWHVIDKDGKPVAPTLKNITVQAAGPEVLTALIRVTNELDTLRADYDLPKCSCLPDISFVCCQCAANAAIDKAEAKP